MRLGTVRPARVDPLVVLVVGAVVRFGSVLAGRGGLRGDFGYDQGVYFAAADALIHGRMPYADFVLLHPPALMLALTPFAALGSVTTDHTGFIAADLAFEVLGGVNAALVLLIARWAGVGRWAALAGGLAYALWSGSVVAETTLRLEPLGNFFLLAGLLLLVRGRVLGWTSRRLAGCGALLTLAVTTKIWWLVPLVIVGVFVAWQARRTALWFVAGVATVAVLVAGPFFVYAPRAMARMIVRDQLGRPRTHGRLAIRLPDIASLHLSPGSTALALLIALLVGVLVVVRSWRFPALRVVAVIGVAQLAVLLISPSYFAYYDDFVAPALGLAVAGVVATVPAMADGVPSADRVRTTATWSRVVAVVGLAVLLVATGRALVIGARDTSRPFPGARLAAAVQRHHLTCVMSDSPMALIELDALSRGFAAGCPNRVDVSGSALDRDRPPSGRYVPLVRNRRWQRDVYRYLRSGNAEIVVRRISALSPATTRKLDRFPVVVAVHGLVLRRTT